MADTVEEKLTLFNETLEDVEKKKEFKAFQRMQKDEIAEAYWKKCIGIIRDNIDSQSFLTWFEPIKAVRWRDNKLTLEVPSQFFFEWIEEHYYDLLQKTIYQVMGEKAGLKYQVLVDDGSNSTERRRILINGLKYQPSTTQTTLPFAQRPVQMQDYPTFLNARYSFDNFVIGDSNQLARSAAMAVSQNPGGTRFNPLVVYGATGLGKTHLAQAIGNYIIRHNDRYRVLYTNSERFTMEFVNAIQNNKTNEFINFYRSIDVLIVDDIQFFSGKEKTQDNFFHTFNALHQAGKQLVLSSDRPPRDLKGVDDRLISRFQWGLTVDIQQPDLEMRMAILRKKSMDEGLNLPTDTVEYLARHVKTSIRELEGILISLIAKVTLDGCELNLDLAREVVHGTAGKETKPLTIDDIKQFVADYYSLTVEILESKSRKHEVALARQMAMYLAKQLTENSLKSIGRNFGGRDHSTVLHAISVIENYLVNDRAVKSAFETLIRKLKKS